MGLSYLPNLSALYYNILCLLCYYTIIYYTIYIYIYIQYTILYYTIIYSAYFADTLYNTSTSTTYTISTIYTMYTMSHRCAPLLRV